VPHSICLPLKKEAIKALGAFTSSLLAIQLNGEGWLMLRSWKMETSGLIEIFERRIRSVIKLDVKGKCNLPDILCCYWQLYFSCKL